MMGQRDFETKLYYQLSLDQLVHAADELLWLRSAGRRSRCRFADAHRGVRHADAVR